MEDDEKDETAAGEDTGEKTEGAEEGDSEEEAAE